MNPKKANSTSSIETITDRILDQEIQALEGLRRQLDPAHLQKAVEMILGCEGMVMTVAAGTSGSIARRLAHVLTCSGAPALFLDPGQAQHGYSGIISNRDLLIAFSRGGETDEVNHALHVAKDRGAASIGILEESNSTMAELCDVILTARVAEEHNAVGVIPLASTLAHAAVGDILCAGVLSARGHGDKEFGTLHPGGAVGKRLEQKSSQTTSSIRESKLPALEKIKGLILDMDGVLWHGEKPLPGLIEFFEVLERCGIRYVLATNNPSKRPEGFAEKARSFGVPIEPADVVSSVLATIHYMKSHYPEGIRVHVIGEPAMKELIAEAGYMLADEKVAAVIVALERGLTYETFKRGTLLIRAGADFIGTNGDPSYPTEEGFVPGSGMMVTALAASSDVKPLIIGKPERGIFDLSLDRLQLPLETIASVGDRLDTDIAGGQRFGTKTILMLSGIAQEEDLRRSPVQPDWVFSDLIALAHALESATQ